MKKIIYITICLVCCHLSFSQDAKSLRIKNFNIEKTLAIQGYDPVSYFSGQPKEGKKELNAIFEGVSYRFSTAANLDLFKSNPAKYEPAYGGWCAYAMGKSGEKVEIDPETYKIIEGKNYLFYNKFFTNTLPEWNKMEANLKKKAEENWNKLNK